MINRRQTKKIKVGNTFIGGDAEISIQSMATFTPLQTEGLLNQIKALEAAGCEFIRVAVPTIEDAKRLGTIKEQMTVPLIADVHFDHKIAIEAIKNNVDKLRINPGNIGNEQKVKEVIKYAKDYHVPIRIGVNGGSLKKEYLQQYGGATPLAIVESAMEHIKILEDNDFYDIILSLKSSDILKTIEAYELMATKVDYPFHIGITEAGTLFSGTIKSSIGIGNLLLKGLGDTLRVSLTADPVEEVKVGKNILKFLHLRKFGPEIISCPTCGRTNIDIEKMANAVEAALESVDKDITVAVMGCGVNGPGEAKEADIGIAGGVNEALLFKKGKIIKKIPSDQVVDVLLEEIKKL